MKNYKSCTRKSVCQSKILQDIRGNDLDTYRKAIFFFPPSANKN